MTMQTIPEFSTYEQTVIKIIRKLPPERALQLVDFAQFLELQIAGKEHVGWLDEAETETEEESRASEEKWDDLFAKPEAKTAMREMAQEALEAYRTGQTTDIAITKDGRLAPA